MSDFIRMVFGNISYIIAIVCVIYTVRKSKKLFVEDYASCVETSFNHHFIIRWSMFIAGGLFGIGTYLFITDYGKHLIRFVLF